MTIDPDVPVHRWGLSDQGRERMSAFSAHPFLANVKRVISSEELKAVEAANLLAARLGQQPAQMASLGENDRTATGYLPKAQFEAAADEFFAHPDRSYRGWETATAAQARIVATIEQTLRASPDVDIAIVSHGAVGTLLKCFLKGIAITRTEDQTRQGHYFVFETDSRKLLLDWTPLESPWIG
ncbi:histidine phosphatase family protein [Roseateles chitinivorans]|uniref:histidine phosphatase family protein n=1 Tax=Roseateles chitinivorans TaxID=2917965 RepID=UPI003D6677E8